MAAIAVRAPGVSGQTAPAALSIPTLTAPDAQDLRDVAPLVSRGLVMLTFVMDHRENNRVTHVFRVRAPIATVRSVITHPEAYPQFMPIVRSVNIEARFGRRTSFQFRAAAAMFDVNVHAAMHEVSDRRVDMVIAQSDLGASASRWDLTEESSDSTLVALTMWCDPGRGNWLMQQVVAQSPWAPGGASVVAGGVLALGVRRYAENLAGAHLPIRPATPTVRADVLQPPTPGTWMNPTQHRRNVVAVTLDAQGAMREVSAVSFTTATPAAVAQRMADVEHYNGVWSWLTAGRVVSRPTPNAVRFELGIGSPQAAVRGELVRTIEDHGMRVCVNGVAGGFAGENTRWDVVPASGGGTYLILTGGSEANHLGFWHRMIAGLDPWAVVGLTVHWKMMFLLHGLAGIW